MSISNSVFLFDEHPGKGWSRKPAGTWICKYYGKDCETKHNLLEHYKSHPEYKQVTRHDDNKWECEYCKETFRTRKLLFNHFELYPASLAWDSVQFDDENKHCIRVKAKNHTLARRLRRSTANAKEFSHKLLETFSRAYDTEEFKGVTPTSDYMLGNKVSEFGLWFGFKPIKQTLQKVKLIAEKMVRPDNSIVTVEKRKHRIVLVTKGLQPEINLLYYSYDCEFFKRLIIYSKKVMKMSNTNPTTFTTNNPWRVMD